VKRALGLLASCTAVIGCGGAGNSSGTTRLVVSAPASTTEPLTACAPSFDRAEKAGVRLSFAGSDQLAAQLRQGAKVDVYAAADTKLPDELHSDGLLDRPVRFATNELVLAVPKDSRIRSIEDLTKPGTKLVVGSASVPIGSYARQALAKLAPAQEKAILANVRSDEPDVRGIIGKLTQGAADAGFVYVTDVKAAGRELEAIALPRQLEPRVTYGAGVASRAEQPGLAKRFVDGLTHGGCADALRSAGFGPAP
jgi:molybdate transport system substrate-binding protein